MNQSCTHRDEKNTNYNDNQLVTAPLQNGLVTARGVGLSVIGRLILISRMTNPINRLHCAN